MEEITSIRTILPVKNVALSNIHQGLPDDSLHQTALGEKNHVLGDLVCGKHAYVIGGEDGVQVTSGPAAFSSPAEFFRYFLVDPSGRDIASALQIDEASLFAANRFYKTAMLDRDFSSHPDELKKLLLNRKDRDSGLQL